MRDNENPTTLPVELTGQSWFQKVSGLFTVYLKVSVVNRFSLELPGLS